MRIPVQNPDLTPAMPTTPARARKWVESGKAVPFWSDLNIYCVRLVGEPSGRDTQPVVVGIDPGKLYSGIAVQSAKFTLFAAHLVLPFKTVKDRMEQRAMMRRNRRGRRIDRKVAFHLRAHRQKRFSNRRSKKVPSSIRISRERGHVWSGEVTLTTPVFKVIRRPPISRRQLHLMVPTKGGIRRKYGGTTTRHGFRKGDLVDSPKGIGYVSGDTQKQISVSDSNWKRLGQISAKKVTLFRRSNGLLVA